jgi:hypothetical protein
MDHLARHLGFHVDACPPLHTSGQLGIDALLVLNTMRRFEVEVDELRRAQPSWDEVQRLATR